MESIKDLAIPLLIIGSLSLYFCKFLLEPSEPEGVIPEPPQETLTLNIFKGRNSQVITVSSLNLPEDLARMMYTEEELQGNKVIFVHSGRKLSNDRTFGIQGVRTNDFLHSQAVSLPAVEAGDRSDYPYVTILISIRALLVFLVCLFNYPDYFSFVTRGILIGISVVLSIYLYFKLKYLP